MNWIIVTLSVIALMIVRRLLDVEFPPALILFMMGMATGILLADARFYKPGGNP